MQANPEKYQAISLGQNTHDKNIILNLDGISIVCDDEVKLLGVTIDFKLNFNSHNTNICKKAARQLNVLTRIGKHLDRFGKLTIYHSFIMSNFSYCSFIWHFCTEQTSPWAGFELRTLVVIGTDYIGSCNFNYHTIMTIMISTRSEICYKPMYKWLYNRRWHVIIKSQNHISGIMVNALTLSAADRGPEPRRIKSQRLLNWYLLLLRYARGRTSESG